MRNRIITLMTLLGCAVMTMATERFVSFSHDDVLLNEERVVNVYVEPDAPRGVLIAAKNLCEDIQKVCGTDAQISVDKSKADIVVRVVPNGHWEDFILTLTMTTTSKGQW